MFNIARENFEGLEKIKLYNGELGEYVSIIPTYGGNIQELVLYKNNELYSLIEGSQTLASLSGNPSNAFKGAKLSPFPNRVNQGSYLYNGQRYFLEKNNPPHALHGLLWDFSFDVKETIVKEDSIALILEAEYNHHYEGFPFRYKIEVTYTLKEGRFLCSTTIFNTSGIAIPIGDGWHPYFSMGSSINSLKLKIPSVRKLEMDSSLIPTGNYTSDFTFQLPMLISDKVLDHCYELEPLERIVETLLIDEAKNLTIVVWQKTGVQGYNFIQVYTPPDRKSIAIEAMSCAPDAFNNKNGLMILDPKESETFTFGVRLE